MEPTAQQLANRLNPTPVNIQTPTGSGLFRARGDYGSAIYKRNPDGSYSYVDVSNYGREKYISDLVASGGKADQYGNYANVPNSGGQAQIGLADFKAKYGVDYNNLPEYLTADIPEFIGRSDKGVSKYTGDFGAFFGTPQQIQSQTTTINNTPNAIATPEQVAEQMKNPLWNAGAGKPLPDTGAQPVAQVPGAQPLAVAGAGVPGATTPTASALPTPDVILQPGNTGNDVKKLQDFLVAQGLMTQAQVNTGYGIYGPQTTAAVAALQKQLGVDNSSGPGYFGPKTIAAIKSLVGAGGTNTPPAGTGADASGASTANTGTPIPPSTANGKTPLQNTMDTYSAIYKELGIGSIKEQYEKTLKEQEEMTGKMNDEIADVNDDPWLSQGVRDARIRKIQSRYETKLNTLSNYAKLYDSLYQEGIQQTQFLAGQVQTDTNKAMDLAQKKQEAIDALANDNEIVSVNGREVLVNKATGAKIADLGASKVTGTGTGNSNQVTDNERALFGQFRNEPIVKDYNTILSKKLSVDKILESGLGGPGDLATVYEFMKALDPTSVVRETEYASAAASGNVFKGILAKYNGYFNEKGGFLPPEVKAGFQSIINSKLDVQTQLYNNLSNEYKAIAERQGLNPMNVVANYSGGAGTPTSGGNPLPVVLAKGALSDQAFVEKALTKAKLNYTTIVNNAPAGQIPVLDNATGQPGYIMPGEFTSNIYTKL